LRFFFTPFPDGEAVEREGVEEGLLERFALRPF
jgi:hypothetical protein